ncbi:MAG TPA: hypothetical protein VK826_19540 [Bacteroidia bacterium]|nr:hypothetical protein [Bacteroidia bacterium]
MKKTLTRSIILAAAMFNLLLFDGCNKDETPQPTVESHTFSVSTWSWNSPHYYVNLAVPELTADNINTAGVMVYYSANPGTWVSVPYTVYGTIHDYHIGFLYAAGTVEVTWLYDGASSGDDPNTYYGTTVKCKVVVVPSSLREANPDLNWDNYAAVKAALQLED